MPSTNVEFNAKAAKGAEKKLMSLSLRPLVLCVERNFRAWISDRDSLRRQRKFLRHSFLFLVREQQYCRNDQHSTNELPGCQNLPQKQVCKNGCRQCFCCGGDGGCSWCNPSQSIQEKSKGNESGAETEQDRLIPEIIFRQN